MPRNNHHDTSIHGRQPTRPGRRLKSHVNGDLHGVRETARRYASVALTSFAEPVAQKIIEFRRLVDFVDGLVLCALYYFLK